MMEFLSPQNLALIPMVWFYIIVFLVSLAEGTPIVGSVIPGGTTIFAAGAVSRLGVIDPIWVLVVAALGSTIGDLLGFFILRIYGQKVNILKKVLNGVQAHTGWLADIFDKKYFAITVLAKLIPFLRMASSVVSSARTISVNGYVTATVLASILWASVVVGMGYSLSEFINPQYVVIGVVAFFGASALWSLVKHIRKTRRDKRLAVA